MSFTRSISLALIFAAVLSGQARIPGPGGLPAVAPTPTLQTNHTVACGAMQCPGSPPIIADAAFNPAAGTSVAIFVAGCADNSCSSATFPTTIASLSDGSNTITQVATCNEGSANPGYAIYVVQSATGGAHTLTLTFNSGKGWYGSIWWSSWTNLNATMFDTSGCGNTTNTAPTAITSGNLAQANELIIGLTTGANGVAIGAGFTALNGLTVNQIDEYKIGGTAGATTSAVFSQASHSWSAIVGAFKHQ